MRRCGEDDVFRRSFCRMVAGVALHVVVLMPVSAMAANYALLIGVSKYTNKDIPELKGPANDVTLIWRLLTEKRDFSRENIVVLADGLDSGPRFPASRGQPTRKAIMDSLQALSQRIHAGDSVFIYFSGHGSQQPIRNLDQDPERGNLDQVMLPIDSGNYDSATQTIRNGIVDDDLGAALDKIRDTGADVWIVIDACHAGTMTRGPVEGFAVRGVDPVRLGMDSARLGVALAAPRSRAISRIVTPAKPSGTKVRPGSLTGFFAVDSSREAIERSFDNFDPPMIGEGPSRRVGVFTYFFYNALATSTEQLQSYRQLAHHIVRTMQNSRVAPPAMPMFDGNLDRPILAAGKALPPPMWQVDWQGSDILIPAGALHGLSENTVLALSESTAPGATEWGRATVTQAEPIRSTARLISPISSGPPPVLWARMMIPGVSFRFAIAEPPQTELADPVARTLIAEMKAWLRDQAKGAIDWLPWNATADLRLRVHDNRLWLLPADGDWIRKDFQEANPKLTAYPLTPSYPLNSRTADEIGNAIHRIVKANNMVRIAEASTTAERASSAPKSVNIKIERPSKRLTGIDPRRPCPKGTSQPARDLVSIDASLAVNVTHCDLILITIENVGQQAIDVNLSAVTAQSEIEPFDARHCTSTLWPGGRISKSIWVTTWDGNAPSSVGREHIIVTWAEQRNGIQADLCFTQEAVRGAPRSAGTAEQGNAGWLVRALRQAVLAPAARRGIEIREELDAPDAPAAGMFHLTLQVTPP